MRLATWNVNSVRTRVDRVIAFLKRENVDVLAMQEIKCRPEQFPLGAFAAAGYEVAVHGLNQWNGVAIASRVGLADVATSFPGQPAWAAKEGAEAVECVADDDHAFVLGAAFEADEFFQCLCVRRQAAEPVAGFGGVGDEAAAFEVVFQTA